ncbi:surface carbohydrate biosynthesis protein [Gracilibacillus kekensis]|uniref:Surface carbohydrate biosynthesis protein n=1 Tax=Gracilibacillus kekensis TaxID=1027249 RepID=A0A1M7NT34_9BACI|nr:surface carbohydrate biosynthesis protein [Gracilibacillus kekensis]SHN07181.1 surface carbohydrate biosynthesis protein [Gracilibacillus kekensis]
MTNKRFLYLPVEVKVRELDAKLLLSYYAMKQGYQVIIGDHPTVVESTAHFPAGIFLAKGGPKGFRKRTITKVKENGQIVVELDEEGLLIEKSKYIRDRMRKDMLQFVEQEYCWGDHQKQIISNTYPDLATKCKIVGNPRLDLLSEKYREIYRLEAKAIQEKYHNFILVNTRFPLYNASKGLKENSYVEPIKKLYIAFLEMIEATAKRFPEKNIVIRPHPGENRRTYQQRFKQFHNVHIIHEGSIINWLLAANVIIHNGCTSGIEAFLLDKPVISYIPFVEKNTVLPNQVGLQITTIPSLQQAILNISDYNQHKKVPESLYHHCFMEHDSYSYDRILQLCNRISLPSPPPKISPQRISIQKQKRRFSLLENELMNFYQKIDQIEQSSFQRHIDKIAPNAYRVQAIT